MRSQDDKGNWITLQIEPGELGPHMRALAPKQRAFVFALVETNGNATQAALAAGYGAESATHEARVNAARSRGYQLIHDEKILKAIKEEAQKRLNSGGLIAASLVLKIAQDDGHKGQMKAIQMLLDRSGLQVAQEINVNVGVPQDVQRTINEIVSIARGLNFNDDSTRLLLGSAGVDPGVIDAEFQVIHQPLAIAAPVVSDPFYVPPKE